LRLKRMTETHQRKVKKGIGPLASDKSEQKKTKKRALKKKIDGVHLFKLT